jgi:hypothetical protein
MPEYDCNLELRLGGLGRGEGDALLLAVQHVDHVSSDHSRENYSRQTV